ncbi:FUSC family protein [Cupriavidus basilensis]|uniref:FUSC family protein n=1 Tax=Cupriavidus basilensis TaxID=68895 RepID=UPI0039F6DBD7
MSFITSSFAPILGAVAAARTTALVRGVGRKWSAKQIRGAYWRDLADLAAHPQDSSAHDAHAGRMLDRIAQLAPRVAPGDGREVQIAA